VLTTALDRLARDGYGNLTADAVAAAAHTSKATIYRQWGGEPGLVSGALGQLRRLEPDAPSPDAGSLRGDLLRLARTVGPMGEQQVTLMAALPTRPVMTGSWPPGCGASRSIPPAPCSRRPSPGPSSRGRSRPAIRPSTTCPAS
jgi:AcrR family transcriptional regulator